MTITVKTPAHMQPIATRTSTTSIICGIATSLLESAGATVIVSSRSLCVISTLISSSSSSLITNGSSCVPDIMLYNYDCVLAPCLPDQRLTLCGGGVVWDVLVYMSRSIKWRIGNIFHIICITGCQLCNAAVNANNILCPECIQLFCTMDTRDYVDITASCLKGKLHHPINVISQVECSVIV